MTSSREQREREFRQCYAAHFGELLAYARRRVDEPADAGDVVAETFLVAWRRFAELPAGEEARLWLFGVARKVLANQRRGDQRRHRLGDRLRQQLDTGPTADSTDAIVARRAVLAAMRRLNETDREVLALHAWEELEPREIAVVLGIGPGAARTRLNRARTRLKQQLGDDFVPGGHVPDDARVLTEEHR